MNSLRVSGVTNTGKFVRTLFDITDTFTWAPWVEVNAAPGATDPGPFSSIDSAQEGPFTHICGITADGQLLHTLLDNDATQWGSFDNLRTIIGGDPGQFLQVRIDIAPDGLHLCVLTRMSHGQQHILHAVRHFDGTWNAFQDITQEALAGFPGSFVSVDCVSSRNGLHICGVTADGKLWHTSLSDQNVWSKFAPVQSDLPKDTGHSADAEDASSSSTTGGFTSVCIASSGDLLHVCALRSRVLLHTILFSNPVSWQPVFDNVYTEATNPGVAQFVDCANADGILHVCVITRDEKLWHAMRFEQPEIWVPFSDATAIIGDLSILLKIICLLAIPIVLTFKPGPCPAWASMRISRDCATLKSHPNLASAMREDIQVVHSQAPGCSGLSC